MCSLVRYRRYSSWSVAGRAYYQGAAAYWDRLAAKDCPYEVGRREREFWRTGFDELTRHSADGASQWVGRRLLTGFIVAVMMACVVWLAKPGWIK